MEYVLRQKQDLSPYLRRCKTLQLSPDYIIPHDVDEETTHSTIVEGDEHTASSDSERLSLPCTRFQIMNRKASWPCISATSPAAASDVHASRNMSRRKGVPHRSPLCWEMVIPAVQPISPYLSPSFFPSTIMWFPITISQCWTNPLNTQVCSWTGLVGNGVQLAPLWFNQTKTLD